VLAVWSWAPVLPLTSPRFSSRKRTARARRSCRIEARADAPEIAARQAGPLDGVAVAPLLADVDVDLPGVESSVPITTVFSPVFGLAKAFSQENLPSQGSS
jgi:hypothetical protein